MDRRPAIKVYNRPGYLVIYLSRPLLPNVINQRPWFGDIWYFCQFCISFINIHAVGVLC